MFVYVEQNGNITAFCADGGISAGDYWKRTSDDVKEPITDEHGIPLYKFAAGNVSPRTKAEIDAEYATQEAERRRQEETAPATWQETVEAQIMYTALMTDTLLEG